MYRRFAWLTMGVLMLLAPATHAATFQLGLDVFLKGYTQLVAGKRVGLITNQTGRDAAGVSTIDLLHQHPQINLVALFAAEHGIRGKVLAGEKVDDERDSATGLPILSLYGIKGRAPTPEMLAQIDVLIYDMQDVGSRAYTYIWTMANSLEAAGKAGKSFIVLDRPNPLGGRVIDGPVTEPHWKSFLGVHPIPRVYGMTAGELARMFNKEYDLGAHLVVVPMSGYTRDMSWNDTRLSWIAPSPNIPNPESAVCFAATGTIGALGTAGIDIGISTELAFQVVGASWLDAREMAEALNQRGLPAVRFQAHSLDRGGKQVPCVLIRVTDPTRFFPSITEIVILQHLLLNYPRQMTWPADPENLRRFDNANGTSSVRTHLQQGKSINEIVDSWKPLQQSFLRQRAKYLIYP